MRFGRQPIKFRERPFTRSGRRDQRGPEFPNAHARMPLPYPEADDNAHCVPDKYCKYEVHLPLRLSTTAP